VESSAAAAAVSNLEPFAKDDGAALPETLHAVASSRLDAESCAAVARAVVVVMVMCDTDCAWVVGVGMAVSSSPAEVVEGVHEAEAVAAAGCRE
jgi:hypothetical protein